MIKKPASPILDLTQEFKSTTVDWTLTGESLHAQFAETVRRLRVGLYSSLYSNTSRFPIYDRNGPGKVIVPANGNTLKSGKFEQGLVARKRLNHVHLHRRGPDHVEDGIFRDSLQLLLVLNLSHLGLQRTEVRAFETFWNRSLKSFLRDECLADGSQDGRSESRYVTRPPTRRQLQPLLSDLADRILAAAASRGGASRLRAETYSMERM